VVYFIVFGNHEAILKDGWVKLFFNKITFNPTLPMKIHLKAFPKVKYEKKTTPIWYVNKSSLNKK